MFLIFFYAVRRIGEPSVGKKERKRKRKKNQISSSFCLSLVGNFVCTAFSIVGLESFFKEINNILEDSLRNKIMTLAVFLVRKLNLLHFVISQLIFDFLS